MHAPKRLLLALLLAVVGCGGETEGSPVTGVPWHMWGNSQTMTLANLTPLTGPLLVNNSQLLQVLYARPETWTFIIEAKLLDASGGPPAGTITVDFEVQLGLGRNTIIIPSLCRFTFDPTTDVGLQRYCTTVAGPPRVPGDVVPNVISEFQAQNIQTAVKTSWSSAGVSTAHLEVAMQVAPKTHIRPEWFSAAHDDHHGRYPGGENRGL